MVPESDAWDIELLLAVEGLPWDHRRTDPAVRIHLPAPEVPPEHVLPPLVGELAGPRSRRVYIRRDVEIRKYGVTIGCPGAWPSQRERPLRGIHTCAGARIEQKMLEDTTRMRARLQARRGDGGASNSSRFLVIIVFPVRRRR